MTYKDGMKYLACVRCFHRYERESEACVDCVPIPKRTEAGETPWYHTTNYDERPRMCDPTLCVSAWCAEYGDPANCRYRGKLLIDTSQSEAHTRTEEDG